MKGREPLRGNDTKRIAESEWRWRGMPGHFICSEDCCFHMVTDIGGWRVSSIGCYHKPLRPRESKTYDNRSQVGSGRLYETYVFPIRDDDEIDPSEVDSEGYNDEAEAERGHMAMCRKVASWSLPELATAPFVEGDSE